VLYIPYTGSEENNNIVGDEREMGHKEIRKIVNIGPPVKLWSYSF